MFSIDRFVLAPNPREYYIIYNLYILNSVYYFTKIKIYFYTPIINVLL